MINHQKTDFFSLGPQYMYTQWARLDSTQSVKSQKVYDNWAYGHL